MKEEMKAKKEGTSTNENTLGKKNWHYSDINSEKMRGNQQNKQHPVDICLI